MRIHEQPKMIGNELFINELKSVIEEYIRQNKKYMIYCLDDTYHIRSLGDKTYGNDLHEYFSSYIVALHYALNSLEVAE